MTMTDFQESLRRDISDLLERQGVPVSWSEGGLNERYYYCSVAEYQMEIWIYTDEACCQIEAERRLYERPAYPSLEQLKMEVLEFVKEQTAHRMFSAE